MADELHVLEGLVDRHGLRGEDLGADDHGAVVVLVDGLVDGRHALPVDPLDELGVGGVEVDLREAVGRGLLQGDGSVVAAMDLLLVLGAAQPFEHAPEGEVEGRELVGGAALGADDGAGPHERDLHAVVACGPAGLLAVPRDLDVERDGLLGELDDLVGLLGGVHAESVGDLRVAAGDVDVHDVPPDHDASPAGRGRSLSRLSGEPRPRAPRSARHPAGGPRAHRTCTGSDGSVSGRGRAAPRRASGRGRP